MSRRRGATRRDVARGSLALLLGAAAGCGRIRRSPIEGALVDTDVDLGHALRDGALGLTSSQGARRERVPVLVVGGGAAGLSAAWRVARDGVQPVVLELAQKLGGTSRGGELAGLAHPWGAHYLPVPRVDQRALAAFLIEAGLARSPSGTDGTGAPARLDVDPLHLVRAPAERLFALGVWRAGLWPDASGPDEGQRERFEALLDAAAVREASGARPFDLPVARSGDSQRRLDATSAAEFAREHGFDGERMRWWLEYATRDDFGARLEDTSAWALLHYFTARRDAAGGSGEYMTWPEGNARLVHELRRLAAPDVRTRVVALSAAPRSGGGVEVLALDLDSRAPVVFEAEHAILATPQFITRRLLLAGGTTDPADSARASFRYGPWVVANLHLAEAPPDGSSHRAWDNVRYGAPSLGYVDATHQLDRADRDTVWTWYLPVTDSDERAARAQLLSAPWEHWRDAILTDLRGPHPELAERVTRLDVWRWGHAMVKPVPGFLWSGARERAAAPLGDLHFAHTDLSGMALFEEAHWHGTRAAEAVLAARGVETEALA